MGEPRLCRLAWNDKDPATPALLPSLFADIGFGEEDAEQRQAWEATRKGCCAEIREGGYSMGEIEGYAHAFYDGYMAGSGAAE